MSDRPTRVPAISTPTDDNLRDVARQIKSILDVREGVSGDPLDKVVTFRDLETFSQSVTTLVEGTTGAATTGSSTGVSAIPSVTGTGAYDPTTDLTVPEAPEGFTATGLFASVQLEWLAPRIKNYAYTEIWSADTDQIGSAVLLGSAAGTSFVDYLASSTSRYYWARFVTQANVTGPYNSTSGTIGTTAPNPGLLLESLVGQITESELYQDLSDRINLIDAPDTTPGSVAAKIKTETDARVAGDEAVAQSVTQLASTVGSNTVAIQTEATTRANETGSLFAKYTVKIDNNGYVSGFGLASTSNNDTPFSSFVIRADSFSISSPSGPGIAPITPFVVQTGSTVAPNGSPIPPGVYIDGAFIKKATVTAATIGSVDADTIKAGFTSSVDMESSVFYGSEFYIGGTATYEYNYPGQPNRKTGISFVTNPNIALTRDGANFDVNYFRITNGGSVLTPFEVVNGVVRIQTAAIGDGTITTAKIADTIQSTNYVQGQTGWRISKSGLIELQNAVVRGDVQATSLNAATGTFSGTLTAANGVFTGELRGVTGEFAGTLTAGTVDISKLVGQSTTYNNPGTYYITVPAGLLSCRVTLVGAGGGGSTSTVSRGDPEASGSGGGGGGVSVATFNGLTAGALIVLTVGAGGPGGANRSGNAYLPGTPNLNGTSGGNTVVSGAINLFAGGGGGGTAGYENGSGQVVGAGGYGTTASGSPGTLIGNAFSFTDDTYNYNLFLGGSGGNSGLGFGRGGVQTTGWVFTGVFADSAGIPGTPAGGGGSGGNATASGVGALGGGAGAHGKAIIEFFNPNGVVIRSEWNTLIAALQRQNIQTT